MTTEQTHTREMLFCVGCGNDVAQRPHSGTLAIACGCGAAAPLLMGRESIEPFFPVSLQRIRFENGKLDLGLPGDPPHLEYYLGYSDHESMVKSMVIFLLSCLGATSQGECSEPRCLDEYWKGRARCQAWLEWR